MERLGDNPNLNQVEQILATLSAGREPGTGILDPVPFGTIFTATVLSQLGPDVSTFGALALMAGALTPGIEITQDAISRFIDRTKAQE
jgi:hypothetical protein